MPVEARSDGRSQVLRQAQQWRHQIAGADHLRDHVADRCTNVLMDVASWVPDDLTLALSASVKV